MRYDDALATEEIEETTAGKSEREDFLEFQVRISSENQKSSLLRLDSIIVSHSLAVTVHR